jgi:hypothetical protein
MPKPRGKQRWITYLSQKNCDQLGFPEWVDITGFGVGRFGLYDITLSGVRFHGYSNSEIERAPVRDQAFMVRANENLPLTFPCTLQSLLDFVDGPAGQIGGRHFSFPKGFREAAALRTKSLTVSAESANVQKSGATEVESGSRQKSERWKDEELRALLQDQQHGATQAVLAKKHGLSRQRIGALLVQAKSAAGAKAKIDLSIAGQAARTVKFE